jgi:hypothetical protein
MDGSVSSVTSIISNEFEVVKINNPNKLNIAFVLFDPNSIVLKQLSFKKSFDELKFQADQAKFMLDRYDAVVAMKQLPIEQKRTILLKVLNQEKHEGIINEIVSQLGSDQNSQSAINKLASSPKSAIRYQIIKMLEPTSPNKDLFEKALLDSSYDVVKLSLEKLCNQYPLEVKGFLHKTSQIEGMNHSVQIKWLEISILNNVEEQNARKNLTLFASENYEFRTKILAFAALKSTNTCNEEVARNLLRAILSSNGRLAGPATDLAIYFCSNLALKKVFVSTLQNQNFTDQEKNVLTKALFLSN